MARISPRRPAVHPLAEAVESRLLMNGTTETFSTLTSADFNNDGSADSLVRVMAGRRRLANLGFVGGAFRKGSLVVLDGSGALLDPLGIRCRGSAVSATADFNSDGNLDLVLGGRRLSGGGARNGLTFFPGNGDGSFGTGVPIPDAPSNVTSLAARDVNGDGDMDLIGTARGRGGAGNLGLGITDAVREEQDTSTDNGGVAEDLGPSDAGVSRPHLVGVSAEAGGGVVTGSTLLAGFAGVDMGPSLFGVDVALPPGFTPLASRVGVGAEAGGARVGGFGNVLIDSEDAFVLFGNGDGTFTSTLPTDDAVSEG